MKDQLTVLEVREIIKITRNIAPILNRDEMRKIVAFYNQAYTGVIGEIFRYIYWIIEKFAKKISS